MCQALIVAARGDSGTAFFFFPPFFSKEGCNGSDVREAKKKIQALSLACRDSS